MAASTPSKAGARSSHWIPTRGTALRIALYYLLFGGLWILGSGWALHRLVHDPFLVNALEHIKGWCFVGVTAWLLFLALDRQFREVRKAAELLQESHRRLQDAQQAALESGAKLEAALSSMSDAVFIADAAGKLVHINDAFARFHKFASKAQCAASLDEYAVMLEAMLPNGASAPLEQWAVPRALRGETVTNAEYILRRKDTGETWVGGFSFAPIRSSSGVIVGAVATARDITEQKRVEAELLKSETRYRLVSENVSDAIWLFNLALNRFTYVSPSVERLRGYTVAEVLEQDMAAALTPESYRMVAESLPGRLAEFAAGNDSVLTQTQEVWQPCRDGTTVLTEVVTTLIADSDRRVTHIQGVSRDLTERMQAETALRESEAQFRAAFEVASIGMAQADPTTGRWLRVNQRACAITGYSRDEMLSMAARDITHPDDRDRDWETFQAIMRGDASNYHVERRFVRKDGTVVWVSANVAVVRDASGKPLITVEAMDDISERVRADAFRRALLSLGARLNNARDAASAGRALLEVADRLWKWNAATLSIVLPGADRPHVVLKVDTVGGRRREVLADNLAIAEAAHASARPTDEPRASVMSAPVHRDGKVVGSVAIESDVPNAYSEEDSQSLHVLADYCGGALDRIRSEDQLRQAQKLEAIGQLAGGVAHDFNNILAAIMMQVGLIQQGFSAGEDILESIRDIEIEAKRAAALTRQLLMFSRRSVLAMRALSLNEIVANLLKMLARVIGEHIELRFDPMPGIPSIEADAGMMNQVVMNLVVNARDAMPDGGSIAIRTSVNETEGAPESGPPGPMKPRPGRFVCLSVADTGCGMSDETMKRVFDPFFTTKEPGKGTGLGLATVYGIVSQHKGWIEIDSAVAVGSTFRVYLPAVSASAPTPTQRAPDKVSGGTETILFVEDNSSLRHVVARALRAQGYRVHEAQDGRDAMALWDRHGAEVDLLLTDMVMPEGLTGMDLVANLRAKKPSLKAIISSGYGVEGPRLHDADIAYLPKPYEARELCRTVRRCLDGTE